MNSFLNILYAILIFGVLIFVHELGHLLAAKATGVKVNGFSLGLGPRLCGFKIGETDYNLRLLPIGGACMMEGEDEDSVEPRAFKNKPLWARFVVIVAGSAMNFLFGFIVIIALLLPKAQMVTNVVDSFPAELGESNVGVIAGDEFYEINGERVYTSDNVAFLFQRYDGEPYTITVIRDGEYVTLENVELAPRVFEGSDKLRYGFNMRAEKMGFFDKIDYGARICCDYVRMIRMGFADLFKGDVDATELTGPIGITATLSQVDNSRALWSFAAFIAINLAVMNMLPLPALDGGRVLFLLIELLLKPFGKRLNSKYEAYIHFGGLILFLLLMVYVGYNDVARLIG